VGLDTHWRSVPVGRTRSKLYGRSCVFGLNPGQKLLHRRPIVEIVEQASINVEKHCRLDARLLGIFPVRPKTIPQVIQEFPRRSIWFGAGTMQRCVAGQAQITS
jgi:hypothetical protein